jgi:hypothetical protein
MPLSDSELESLVRQLVRRPGHETVRVHLCRALIDHLGASETDIIQEQRIEARSRVDTLLGDTVFELKTDIRREIDDARFQLERYLTNRQAQTGRRFVGVATDGLDYHAYELREGTLTLLNRFQARADAPRELMAWLESVVSVSPDLPANALTVTQELGRGSTAYARARGILEQAWRSLQNDPEALLKRQLWADLLGIVYGSRQDADALWFQHSYLTIVAKAFGFSVLHIEPIDPEDLLTGRSLAEADIHGAIESDFFDWILKTEAGRGLISQLQRRVSRFRIRDVDLDILKVLYESLIDPEQRHDLGEYYTPDWLAFRVREAAIDDPMRQKVLDPACGSGAFLFHAVRRFIAAAQAASVELEKIAQEAAQRVIGMDIHPVAVIIARITYLLALGTDVLQARRGNLSIPVYLGDALQWSVTSTLGHEELEVRVPASRDGESRTILKFPIGVAKDPGLFDWVIATLLQASERRASASDVEATLRRRALIGDTDRTTLIQAYRDLRKLREAGRNHVWGYYARNIARPVWLSRTGSVDRVMGNPPWLSLRYMSRAMQARARDGMREYGMWVGGRHATHQDLSGYFFARCVDLYLEQGGRIAFLMPLAAMTRGQFESFRTGALHKAAVSFTAAWTFDERVFPLFPVPSCALFAERADAPARIPNRVLGFAGILSHRNASPKEAEQRLLRAEEEAPSEANFQAATPYRRAFRNGATLFPRLFCYVERRDTGRIGTGARVPVVSKRRLLEKSPWRELQSITGSVERQFLRPALLGESIAPFRILDWPEAIVPVNDVTPIDSAGAAARGYPGLAAWLAESEGLWDAYSSRGLTLIQRLDFWGELRAQFPIQPARVVYAKAGTMAAATLLNSTECVKRIRCTGARSKRPPKGVTYARS